MNGKSLGLGAGLLVCAFAASVEAKEIKRHYLETFEVAPGVTLHLEHGDGDVSVTPWDQDQVQIEVHYRVDQTRVGWGSKPDFKVTFLQDGDDLRVVGREISGGGIVGFQAKRTHEYRYEIKLPTYVAFESRGDDGDLELEGLNAPVSVRLDDGKIDLELVNSDDVRVRADDGDVFLREVNGRINIETEDGNISLVRCSATDLRILCEDGDVLMDACMGPVDVQTDDGDLQIRRHPSDDLELTTEDGDVEVHVLPGRRLQLRVDVDDGNVDLVLAPGISAEFLITTDDGRIRTDLKAATGLDESRNGSYGQLGDADGRIRVRSADGDVSLRDGSADMP